MKQQINLGSTVDDGTGDYIRRGGEKINDNFNDIYGELGDSSRVFSAGAWHLVDSSNTATLSADFGRSYVIDTTTSPVVVNLPNGDATDYGKVIKLRDVWGNWNENDVTIYPASGDTIKGSNNPFNLNRNWQDVELVYVSPNRWDFIDNKLIDKITVSDIPTVAKREYIVEVDGQTDFTDIFPIAYDINNLEVYKRGNLLYYGNELTDDSDYGSMADPEDPQVTGIVALDGNTIRLREPLNTGDVITFVSYSDSLTNFRTSYNKETIKVFDSSDTIEQDTSQEIVVVNGLSDKKIWTLQDFGLSELAHVNPNSFELHLNGRELTSSSEVGEPNFVCVGAGGSDEQTCISNGGEWLPTSEDFTLLQNQDGKYDRFYIIQGFESGDIVTVKWFDNQIGTLEQWEGVGGIKEKAENVFMNTEYRFNRSGKIRYIDPENPSPSNTEQVAGVESNVRFADVTSFLESIFPVGSVYTNANNPNNPADYMGFGKWVRYAEGRTIVGWDSSTDPYNPLFGLNNNDLDENEVPRHTAGGTVGSTSVELDATNIPELTSGDSVLVVDENGGVVIGSCQDDPDSGPALRKYRESQINVNDGVQNPNDISVVQPSITAYTWVRTE